MSNVSRAATATSTVTHNAPRLARRTDLGEHNSGEEELIMSDREPETVEARKARLNRDYAADEAACEARLEAQEAAQLAGEEKRFRRAWDARHNYPR
jgi:hypothetical protein